MAGVGEISHEVVRLGEGLPSQMWPAETLHTPLVKLVDGLEEIRVQPIPYARLPRRLSTYGQEFVTWCDVFAETPQSLMARPKVGESAVRALMEVAADVVAAHRGAGRGLVEPVAAVEALTSRLVAYDRVLLAACTWPRQPAARSVGVAAQRLGVSSFSVRRNQARAERRFRELLAEAAHREVSEIAAKVRQRVGLYAPVALVEAVLADLAVDPEGEPADVLLYVAGPYAVEGGWAENVAEGGRPRVDEIVEDLFTRCPAPRVEAVHAALVDAGMAVEAVEVFMREVLSLRHFGDVCVRWDGENTTEMIEAVLHGIGSAATVEDIHGHLGAYVASLQRVAAVLSDDDRFVRASRRTWKLRRWAGPEYTGIADAIGERIIAHGGRARSEQVVSEVVEQFPDVAEGSVRSYLHSLAFVHDEGWVRRRKKTDPFPDVGSWTAARGVFSGGPDEMRVVVAVTSELLRGSAVNLPAAAASAIGVVPGSRKVFGGDHGGVAVKWKLSTLRGAAVSSLRAHARANGAEQGDLLVLSFHLDDTGDTVQISRIGADVDGLDRLQMIVGCRVDSVAAVAYALDCEPGEVQEVLRRRGDVDLANDLAAL